MNWGSGNDPAIAIEYIFIFSIKYADLNPPIKMLKNPKTMCKMPLQVKRAIYFSTFPILIMAEISQFRAVKK